MEQLCNSHDYETDDIKIAHIPSNQQLDKEPTL